MMAAMASSSESKQRAVPSKFIIAAETPAKAAHADHFILTQPGGYQMPINEEADNVSSGQKQLLTIARAALADRPLLILDEATSNVDTLTEHRIQRAMPLAFYCSPYLVTRLRNYDAVEYYGQLIRIMEAATSHRANLRRVLAPNPPLVRAAHLSQGLSYRAQLAEMRRVRALLKADRQFRAFHENLSSELPDFYRQRIRQRLGRYFELMSDADCRPVLDQAEVRTVGRAAYGLRKRCVPTDAPAPAA